MKRMHIHIAVANLETSIRFYSELFGVPPNVMKPDYAKWMLEDPRVNFAISARGIAPGIDHLGIQVDSDEALEALHTQLDRAGMHITSQEATTCCYVESDKHWVTDPQGIAWETFHTLKDAPTFGSGGRRENSACCAPAKQTIQFVSRRTTPEAP
jgi:catechol 2,3-dioxygenase-like lactoylglutathione lyase family enzyme